MDKYKQHEEERTRHSNAILDSKAHKRLIMAGPGTGKSYLFAQVCKKNIAEGKDKNLTLSFINELVNDLSKDLYGLSEVRTLHSFALGKMNSTKMYLDLGKVIGDDFKIINDSDADYNYIFSNLIDDKPKLEFYSARRKYYDYFSPNCSVYTLIKIFEKNEAKIPTYAQVLVDEFQDFNKLESTFLDYLSKKTPILIAGDDDQSLYPFKHANPGDIRAKNSSDQYERFQLPFCSRCTESTINAFNSIVKKSVESGFLADRTKKDYKYFPTEEKDKICIENPKILIQKNTFQNKVAFFVDKYINENFDPRSKTYPNVLIVCPLKIQIPDIERLLRSKGYKNIEAPKKKDIEPIIEGFKLLLEDSKCNLGWRIVSEVIYKNKNKEDRFNEIVKESFKTGTAFNRLVDHDQRKQIKDILASLNKIKNLNSITHDELLAVLSSFGLSVEDILNDEIKSIIEPSHMKVKNPFREVPIKITTILGSKGLTRDYVFLANFDDKYLLVKNPINGKMEVTDSSICHFLVALTRAKVRTYIFTTENSVPTYIKWADKNSYQEI